MINQPNPLWLRLAFIAIAVGMILGVSCAPRTSSSIPSHELILISSWEERKITGVIWNPVQSVFYVSKVNNNGSQELWAYNAEESNLIWSIDTFAQNPSISSDGKFLAESHWLEGFIRLRNSVDGKIYRDFEANNCTGGNWSVFIDGDSNLITGKMALPNENTSNINIWDLETDQCEKIISFEGYLKFLRTTQKDELLIYGSYYKKNEVIVWDLNKEIETCRQEGDFGFVVPRKDILVVSEKNKLSIWDPYQCQKNREYNFAPSSPNYIDFTSDGNLLVMVDSKYLQIRDADDGAVLIQSEISETNLPSSNIPSLLFSSDGEFILAVFSKLTNGLSRDILQLWKIK